MRVYLDTLFGLCRDAYRGGHREALQFVMARLDGLIPAESVNGFLDSLAGETDADVPPPLPALPVAPERDGLSDDGLAELVAAYVPPPQQVAPVQVAPPPPAPRPPRAELTW